MWGENQSKLVILLAVGNLTQCLLISTPLKAEYLNAPHRLVEGHHIYAKWILDKSLSLPRWSEIVLVLFLAIQTFNGLRICSVYFIPPANTNTGVVWKGKRFLVSCKPASGHATWPSDPSSETRNRKTRLQTKIYQGGDICGDIFSWTEFFE